MHADIAPRAEPQRLGADLSESVHDHLSHFGNGELGLIAVSAANHQLLSAAADVRAVLGDVDRLTLWMLWQEAQRDELVVRTQP